MDILKVSKHGGRDTVDTNDPASVVRYYDQWSGVFDITVSIFLTITTAYVTVHSNHVTILWYRRLYGIYPERDLMLVRLYDNGNIFMSYADWVSPDYWGRDAVADSNSR